MCLSPITIPNQTKYVSLSYSDRFLLEIPCGRCAECASVMSSQWYYRSSSEFDSLPSDGYVMLDCLTYSNKYLPRLSQFWSFLDKKRENFSCFNYRHVRNFVENLRIKLKRLGYNDTFRYFLSSEYGTDDRYTHRPHYHVMFYISSGIDPLLLSRLISQSWLFGRTDGIPYKTRRYVLDHNVIPKRSLGSRLRSCSYVTKYVQKSCEFQSELDKRIDKVMWRAAEYACRQSTDMSCTPLQPEDWLSSEYAHRERLKLMRYVNQFHRQSQHFGEVALRDLDLNQLFRDGCLYMDDPNGVKIPVPLPSYYKRKLFYEQVSVNGSRYWQLTELGREYNSVRSSVSRDFLLDRYRSIVLQYRLPINDLDELVDYVFFSRGRIIADNPESTFEQRVSDCDLFNYSSSSDKLQFGCRGLSPHWLGDAQQGYSSSSIIDRISLSDFIAHNCVFKQHFEDELKLIRSKMIEFNRSKQSAHQLKQRLRNIYKPLTL